MTPGNVNSLKGEVWNEMSVSDVSTQNHFPNTYIQFPLPETKIQSLTFRKPFPGRKLRNRLSNDEPEDTVTYALSVLAY